MNQTFSFPRFRRVVQWELAFKGQSYLLTAVPVLAFLLLMMLPTIFIGASNSKLPGLHFAALLLPVLLGGSLYTNLAFSQYTSRDTGIAALMVPASRLEKVLSALLFNLLFEIPLLLLFLFLHSWTIDFVNSKLPPNSYQYEKISSDTLQAFIIMYVLFQGFLFLGSLYFVKASFVKASAVFIVAAALISQANLWFAEYLASNPYMMGASPFSGWRITFDGSHHYHHIDHSPLFQNLFYTLPLLFLLALWYITYVRLGEKEI
ncbi:hypothetical protein [Telluribacter humicola]|uniref:hypothetical protein n=1 Tax=Telluribacter humicola TaxID=1720261 RepID=UPI001A95B303|nr:hypothetical protein [Telluribacter humicola]